jgi:uncharacterized cofD-like protein
MKILKAFKWLYPGMNVKRWSVLVVFGVIMVSMGFVIVIAEPSPRSKMFAASVIIIGILAIVTGVKRIIKSFVTVLLPQREGELVDKVYQRLVLERGPKVVVIGGGTGLSMLLHGLKEFTSNITAVVTVTDDGGSSGRLRQDMDVLPPGDIRNCLVALADAEPLMGRLFQFRFGEDTELKGHNFGNLFITAMTKVSGNFDQAIKESSKVLAIRGSVVPSTLDKVTLVARYHDGTETAGESLIPKAVKKVDSVFLRPDSAKPTHEAVDAIRKADIIVLGPGSLYTSVLPNLLIEKLHKEVVSSKATKIYVCNVMTQKGETDGYSASDHLKAIVEHTASGIVEYCIVNTAKIHDAVLKKYREEGAEQVAADSDALKKMKCKVIEAHILKVRDYVRHDSEKLAKIIVDLATSLKKAH